MGQAPFVTNVYGILSLVGIGKRFFVSEVICQLLVIGGLANRELGGVVCRRIRRQTYSGFISELPTMTEPIDKSEGDQLARRGALHPHLGHTCASFDIR